MQPNSTAERTEISATYERVSTLDQARHGYSLADQHQNAPDFATANGWVLPEHLRWRDGDEQNASGADWDLPGLNAMLDAARDGQFSILIVPDLDRFARSMVKGLVLEDQLRGYGVRVVFQRVPLDDSPEGRLLRNQLYSFAEYEREKIRLRMMRGARQKARGGEVVGIGPAPYGYRYTHTEKGRRTVRTGLEPDPLTETIARRILDQLLTRSTVELADDLNADDIPGPRGGRWYPGTINAMARNPVYAGTWTFGKHGDPITVEVPALISQSLWDRIQDALQERRNVRRGRSSRSDDRFLLRGMLTCGHCQRALRTAWNSGIRYYRCGCHFPSDAHMWGHQTCPLPDAHAPDLEAELWLRLTDALQESSTLQRGLDAARDTYHHADRHRRERLEILSREIDRERRRLDALAQKIIDASGEVYDALMRQANDIDRLLKGYIREQDSLERSRPDGLSDDEIAAVQEFAQRITVGMEDAERAERREIVELLQIRGSVQADDEGVRFGRKHHFRINWNAIIPLSHSGSMSSENEYE